MHDVVIFTDKKTLYLVGTVIVVFAIVLVFPSNSPQTQANQTTTQATTKTTAVYDFSQVNWLPWLIATGAVIWVIWREKYGAKQKPYENLLEAVKDVEKQAEGLKIWPIVVTKCEFTDPNTKIEAYGSFVCMNDQFPYSHVPIPFAVRKNGVFKYDLTKIFSPSIKEPSRIEIAQKKKEEKK